MKYLVIDASLNGTGIRDQYNGGYIEAAELKLSTHIIKTLKSWLRRYEIEHYKGFTNDATITNLDNEGVEIAKKIKNQLVDVKVQYFSNAKLTTTTIV